MMIDFLSSKLERIIPLGVVPRVFHRDFSRLRRLRRLGFARARLSRARLHPSSSIVVVVALASRLDVHHRPVVSRVTIADLIDFTIASLASRARLVAFQPCPHGAVDE